MKNSIKLSIIAFALSVVAPWASAAGNAEEGEALSAVCAACHGADGISVAPNFPKLAGLGQKYLYKQLRDIKAGNRVIVEMTGLLDNLSDQNLQDLAAYFDSKPMQLSGASPLEVQNNDGEKVDGLALGEKTFRAGNAEAGVPACTGCHSPRALGNEPAGYPRLSGQHAQYIEKQLRDFRAGNRVNDDGKMMRKVAQHLSDAEIVSLANFIAGQH